MARHFAGVASDVAQRLVRVGLASSTGVAWESDLVVGPALDGPTPDSETLVTGAGERLAAVRVAGGPDLPLSAYQVPARIDPAVRRDASAPELVAGQWLVAVWRGASGPAFAPTHFVETRSTQCGDLAAREVSTSLPLAPAMSGGALFDLDEAMVAVVLPCDGRLAALSLESVALGLQRGRGPEARLRALYGLRVAALENGARRHLGAPAGVLVDAVWEGYSAERGGLRPGDVILEAGGSGVATPDDLTSRLLSADPAGVELAVWRSPRRRTARLSPGAPTEPAARPRLGLTLEGRGLRIGPVDPGSAASAAGIQEGDELLRLDGAALRSAAEAARALAGQDRPVFIEFRRGSRHAGALLEAR
jgi:serine protease Do